LTAKLEAESKSAEELRVGLAEGAKESESAIAKLTAKLEAESKSAEDLRAGLAEGAKESESAIATLTAKLEAESKSAEELRSRLAVGAEEHAAVTGEIQNLRTRLSELEPELERLRTRPPEIREIVVEVEKPVEVEKGTDANILAPREDLGIPHDNLKLIHGIGPIIAKRLNAMGIFRFDQIATWTGSDMDAIQAKLPEFQGRIRRDNWVDSAKEEYLKKYGKPIE